MQLCVDIGAHLIVSTETLPPDTETFEQLAQSGVIGLELVIKLKKQWAFATLLWITTMPSTGSWFTALCRLADFSVFAKAVTLTLDDA